MKALRHIIIPAILALGIAVTAASAQPAPGKGRPGQQQGPRGGHGPEMASPLLKGITLTAEQQAKVDAIHADIQKQIQALTPEERRSPKAREIMESRTSKVRAVLTEEQQKIFDKNLKEMQSRFQGKGTPGGKGGKGAKGGGAPKADSEE